MTGAPSHPQVTLDAPQTAAEAPVEYQHTRWNFAVIVADASSFICGLAFASPLIVLPVFMQRLTGSTVLVGVLSAMQLAGWFLPQLITASLVEHRPRKKSLMIKACAIGRVPMALIPLVLLLGRDRPGVVLAVFLSVYMLFYLSDGVTGVPWTDIIGKTIPPRVRGRFFGSMQLIGGVLAVAAGLVVGKVLEHPRLPYPLDYALLFAAQFVMLIVSLGFLALIREPVRPVRGEPRALSQLLRSTPAMLRGNPQFMRMVAVTWLMGAAAIATPFYAVYAHVKHGVPEAMAGVFIWAQMAGGIASSMVWALLSDRRGPKAVIQGAGLCNLAAPAFALLAPLALGHDGTGFGYGFAMTFFLVGAMLNGIWIGFTNFLLEIVSDEDRPSYVGLFSALGAPGMALPVIGGWLIGVTSYQFIFAVAAALSAAGLLLSVWLREPREKT